MLPSERKPFSRVSYIVYIYTHTHTLYIYIHTYSFSKQSTEKIIITCQSIHKVYQTTSLLTAQTHSLFRLVYSTSPPTFKRDRVGMVEFKAVRTPFIIRKFHSTDLCQYKFSPKSRQPKYNRERERDSSWLCYTLVVQVRR